jgi:hypothetical protein
MNIKNAIDKKYETMSLREILKQPVYAIQGISEGDADKMKEAFRISTVEQFAKLRFAKWAWAIQELEKTEKEGGSGKGSLNIDRAVDKAYEGKTLDKILASPMQALQGLSERQAQLMYEAFKVKTVKQLANQRFFRIARAIYFLALCEDTSADPNSKI